MGLITETNAKYYTGSEYYVASASGTSFVAYKGDIELHDDGGGNTIGST